MLPKLPLGRILIKHFATKSFQKPNTNPKHSSFKNSINQSNLNINNTNALDNQSLVLSEKVFEVNESFHAKPLADVVSHAFGLSTRDARLKILGGNVWSTGSLHSKYLDLKPGALVTCGDKIHIRLQSKPVDELKNEKMFNAMLTQLKGSIIYKDERILIINKPINLSVHGGSKHNNLHLEMFLDHLKTKEDEELRIVHRLDKDTTGCLILARTKEAAAQVSSLFNHSTDITKRYIAVCVPPFEDLQTGQSAIITTGISKVTRGNTERMEAVPWDDTFEKSEISDIKKAVTKVTVLKNRKLTSVVCLEPQTGRKHQLRVHIGQLRSFILGDYKYGVGVSKKYRHQISDPTKVPLHLHLYSIHIRDWFKPGAHLTVHHKPPKFWIKTLNSSGHGTSLFVHCRGIEPIVVS